MAKKVTFEASLQTLETLVARLEEGEMTLDESLDAFERGIKAVQLCRQALEQVETRIALLLEEKDGALVTQPAEEI